MGTFYKNKYRKNFIESSQSFGTVSMHAYDKLPIMPFEMQDPTYMGFRIRFIFDELADLNNYDSLPSSLLMKKEDEYSAYQYLININEAERANYLLKFIDLLKSLQNDTPWYFQSINGLDSLQKIDTEKGARTAQDAAVTIEMLESIDQRVSMLINLYRKAAWDSTYQRWMLPENMRWFKVEFTIAEIRDFHSTAEHLQKIQAHADNKGADWSDNTGSDVTGSNVNGGLLSQMAQQSSVANRVGNMINRGKDIIDRASGILNNKEPEKNFSDNFLVNGVNELLPMHVIICDMCEFDLINRNDPWISSVSMGDSSEEIKQEIKIKVGKVIEMSNYTLASLLLRDDNIRNKSITAASLLTSDILARLQDEDLPITRTHNASTSNWLKDRVKSVASTIVTEAVDRFVEGAFMGSAYDGKQLDKNFEGKLAADRAAMSKEIEFNIVSHSDLIAKNIEFNESAVNTSISTEDMIPDVNVNTNVTQINIGFELQSQQQMQSSNVGFILPPMNIEVLGNIGFNE
jgi:hypothetical protein